MTIKQRLALIYALTTMLVICGVSLMVYFFSARFHKIEFFNRLEERVIITEQLFLEASNLEPDVYQAIREKFLHTLTNEKEWVRPLDEFNQGFLDSMKLVFSNQFISDLLEQEVAYFKKGNQQGLARIFHFPEGDYVIIVSADDVFGDSKLDYLRKILLFSLLISAAVALFIGWLAAGRMIAPISLKIQQAKQISASNLDQRLSVVNESDEIGQLAITFNKMLDRIETAFDLQKKFISNASHEIRNPLTAIIGEAEVTLSKERTPEQYQEALKSISEEANRLNQLVNNLLHLAKTGFDENLLRKDQFMMDDLLFDIQKLINFSVPDNKIRIDLDGENEVAEHLEYHGNYNLLKSAILNVLENAIKFSDNQPVWLSLKSTPENIQISVIDQGIGIPLEEIEKINHPFYRASNARDFKGFGIGLSLSQKILQLHEGYLIIEPNQPTGTHVKMVFPRKLDS